MSTDAARVEHSGSTDAGGASAFRGRATGRVDLIEPSPAGPSERVAAFVGYGHPVRVFLVVALVGYALLVAATIAVGLILTRVVLRSEAIASRDERFSAWLERTRTPFRVDLSWIGSTLAGGLVIPVLVGALLVVFLAFRHWRLAAFTLFVICVESGSYRATTLAVHRDRPDVDRLESLPVDASYPSGHTAASVALYGGLLLLLASRVESVTVRLMLWVLAVIIPLFVAWSRLLRGMHHLTDVGAGILMGIAALTIVVFAARAAGAASRPSASERT